LISLISAAQILSEAAVVWATQARILNCDPYADRVESGRVRAICTSRFVGFTIVFCSCELPTTLWRLFQLSACFAALSVGGCVRVTDAGVGALNLLSSLVRLDLSN